MKKWNAILCFLLICSLIMNAMVLLDLRALRRSGSDSINRERLDNLSSEITRMNQILDGIANEQKWVQNAFFTLDKENSRNENMVVEARIIFNRLDESQTPYILYSPKGTDDWEEEALIQQNGPEYSTKLLLSPYNEYDFQVISKGEKETVSDVSLIPYNVYGLPKWNTDLKVSMSNGSNSLDFSLFIMPNQNPPLPEMKVAQINLRLESNGSQPQLIALTEEKSVSSGTWSLKWSLADASVINNYSAYIDVIYENGLQKSEPYELLKERVRYEMNKSAKS